MVSARERLATLLGAASRHGNDRSTEAAFRGSLRRHGLPSGVDVEWLGTAGFRLNAEGYCLLVDPYLTRVRFGEVFRGSRLRVNEELVSKYIDAADAILVGHTHFDHALDVPLIARRSGAKVIGSKSLYRLMAAHGLTERVEVAAPYHVYEIGPFEVTFVPSVHSRLLFGRKVPYEGEITCEHAGDLSANDFRCGDVYGIHIRVNGATFYHQGSADLIDECVRHRDVDFFLAGIAGRGATERYVERVLSRLNPRVVVPMHYDNFFVPLGTPMRFLPNVNLGGFVEEVHAVSSDFGVCALPPTSAVGASAHGNLTASV